MFLCNEWCHFFSWKCAYLCDKESKCWGVSHTVASQGLPMWGNGIKKALNANVVYITCCYYLRDQSLRSINTSCLSASSVHPWFIFFSFPFTFLDCFIFVLSMNLFYSQQKKKNSYLLIESVDKCRSLNKQRIVSF